MRRRSFVLSWSQKDIEVLTGRELIYNIKNCDVAWGQCCLWWLGQQSVIIKLGKTIFGVDIFLSPHKAREIEPFLRPDELVNFDYFLGSHDHDDHIDRAAWPIFAQVSKKANFVVPEALRERLPDELGITKERFLGLDDSQVILKKDIRITAIAAAHEILERDPQSGCYPCLGFVIEGNGCVVYHAGDTCKYEGLESELRRFSPDILLLPINGRDAKRYSHGCMGNMTYQEAADLAGALNPKMVIPTHYDMIAYNGENPQLFIDYMKCKYPHIKTHICQHAECEVVDCV